LSLASVVADVIGLGIADWRSVPLGEFVLLWREAQRRKLSGAGQTSLGLAALFSPELAKALMEEA
jgi:hypothetical protein